MPAWAQYDTIGVRLVLSLALGAGAGLGVVALKLAVATIQDLAYDKTLTDLFTFGIDRMRDVRASEVVVSLIPATGGLLVWSLLTIAGGSRGIPLGELVDEDVPFLPFPQAARAAAAAATLGTGNSLGPEGPAVEIGVSTARGMALLLPALPPSDFALLISAGAAAGVAAGFNAPIAGVFFAIEVAQPLIAKRAPIAAAALGGRANVAFILLSSAVAALVARGLLGERLAFQVAGGSLETAAAELPLYLGLGVLAGLIATTLRAALQLTPRAFAGDLPGLAFMRRVPFAAKPFLAGLACGVVGVPFPEVLFFGYATLDSILADTDNFSAPYLAELCALKLLLTAVCAGSGLVGGTFAPSLFLGATAGAAYQQALLSTTGMQLAGAPVYAMVGAASVLAGLFNAPMTGSLLLFELTDSFDIVLPLTISAGVSSLVNLVLTPPASPTPALAPPQPSVPLDACLLLAPTTTARQALLSALQIQEGRKLPKLIVLVEGVSEVNTATAERQRLRETGGGGSGAVVDGAPCGVVLLEALAAANPEASLIDLAQPVALPPTLEARRSISSTTDPASPGWVLIANLSPDGSSLIWKGFDPVATAECPS